MIIGIGHDLTTISRVEEILARHDERFIQRCFTKAEQQAAAKKSTTKAGIAAHYAKRFAAKEACVKALGTGVNHGIYLHDIGVVNDDEGKPGLLLTGGAAERLKSLVPNDMKAVIHVSLTDEPPLASAYVIIEALSTV